MQCRNGVGVCPDELDSSGECTNDVFGVSGSRSNGEQCVTYSRNLTTSKQGTVIVAIICSCKNKLWSCGSVYMLCRVLIMYKSQFKDV